MSKKNKNKVNKEVKNTEEVVEMENVMVDVEMELGMDDLTIEERKVILELRMKEKKKEKSILTKGLNAGKALKDKIMESKRNKIIAGSVVGLAVAGTAAALLAANGDDEESLIIDGEYDEIDEDELERIENYDNHEDYDVEDIEVEEIETDVEDAE